MTNTETNDKAATVAEQAAHVAPAKPTSRKGASQKKGAPKGRKSEGAGLQQRLGLEKSAVRVCGVAAAFWLVFSILTV
jgi:hypothetical protein